MSDAVVVTGTLTATAFSGDGSNLTNLPLKNINAQTGSSYTLALSDSGKLVSLNNSNTVGVTIPTNASVAFPTNVEIELAQLGVGNVTVLYDDSITLLSYNGANALLGRYTKGTLKKIDTNTWLLTGEIAYIPQVLLKDTFSGSSGVNLSSHTMNSGQGWGIGNSNWLLNGNNQVGVSGYQARVASDADIGYHNVTCSVTWTCSNLGQWAGLFVNNSGYPYQLTGWLFVANDNNWCLYESVNGTLTQRDSVAFTPAAQDYVLKVITNGDTITCYVDGVQTLTYTGSPRTYKTGQRFGLVEDIRTWR